MKQITKSNQFKKDIKLAKKQGKDLSELIKVVEILALGKELPTKYKPHYLSGNWNGYLECHIKPDWLLIYQTNNKEVILYRTGSHSNLFKK